MNKLQKTHALKSALDTELDKLSHAIEKQDETKLSKQDQVVKLRKLKEYELIHLFYSRLIWQWFFKEINYLL